MCTVTFCWIVQIPTHTEVGIFLETPRYILALRKSVQLVLKVSNYSPAQQLLLVICTTGCSVLDYVEPDQWILVDWVDMQTSCRVLAGTNVEGSGEMLKVVVVLLDQLLTLCIRQIKRCLHQVVPLWPVISQLQSSFWLSGQCAKKAN